MRRSWGGVGGGLASVVAVSTVLPAVALFVPLLIIGVLAFGAASMSLIKTQARPALFEIPWAAAIGRLRQAATSATLPEQYRSILDLRALAVPPSGARPPARIASP